MEENSLLTRIGNAQNELSLVFFFSESFEKKGKRCPLSLNLCARALCLTANAKESEGKKRSKSIAYLYLHAFECFLFARFLFSFLCVLCFVCARLF